MKERLKKLAKRAAPYVGYPLFYLFSFGLFALVTFPWDKVRDRIVFGFNAEQRKGPGQQELEIDEVSPAFPLGVKLTGVRLVTPAAEPSAQPTKLEVATLKAKISILPLLIGHQNVTFTMTGLGGSADGEISSVGGDRAVEVALEAIDIGQVGPVAQAIGLPMGGSVSGTVKLTMAEGKAAKASGAVNLEVRDLTVGDGKAKIKNMLALPKVNVGTLTLAAEAKDGNLKLTKLSAGGRDLELQGEGRVALRDMAMESNVDVYVRFKINDAYRGKSDTTKLLFGAPGSTATPTLEALEPRVKRAKREDGFYAWHARGPLARLDFEPWPQYGGQSGGSSKPPP